MNDITACPPAFIDLGLRLADAAGAVVRRYFRTPVSVDDKADASPVTVADREAEAAMRRLIGAEYPEHGIYGEEHGVERPDAEYVWVLDPIDGTKAFITGKPSFGTLIALLRHGRPILGIIDQAIIGERWLGTAGQPTLFNGTPIRVRACPGLGRAALYSTGPEIFRDDEVPAFERLRASVKLTRYGADCYAYGLLALGFVDVVAEATLQPYDYCALIPVIEGAGGIVTDWTGGRLGLTRNARVLAAGDERVHRQAIAALAGERC